MKDFLTAKQKKWLWISLISLLIIVGAGFVYGYSQRQVFLDRAVKKVKTKLKNDYALNFEVQAYRFVGLSEVEFQHLTVIPDQRDTLVDMQRFTAKVDLVPLLWGEIKIGKMGIYHGVLSMVKKDTLSNYDFIFRKKKEDTGKNEETSKSFADLAERLVKSIFSKIPSDLEMEDFVVSYEENTHKQKVTIPKVKMSGGDFSSSVFLNDHNAEWVLGGNIDASNQTLLLEISSKDVDKEVPFLRNKYGLGVSFDKLIFDLRQVKKIKKNLLLIGGAFSYENLKINHKRLSDSTVTLPQAELEGGIEVAENYIALKDKSTIRIKDFEVSPQIKLTLKPSKKVELALHTGMFEAQTFFDAIPSGLFESLEGVQVEGSIAYDLDFAVDLDKPDDVLFVSKIDDEDLKVIRWGKANIDELNHPFVYNAYEDSVLVRQIIVGPENPKFRRLDQIPYVLKTTVRNTEDPYFYSHNGFEQEAFKLSIATNLKEKKFKRGASTISMQLVKNVFLTRKKTLTRKLEEILLVWLMESSGKVSKDRLFEIYLNVIEWGRNVYGITEAADYYFKKAPEELTLGESLFLSSIIPRPKTGLSSFDHTGHLKSWVMRHFNTYGSIMRKLGELNNVDVPENYGFYEVVLQPALRPKAPVVQDSTLDILEEHEMIIRELEEEERVRQSLLEKLSGGNEQ